MKVEEALAQGYEYCLKPDDGYQALTHIKDVEEEDLINGTYVLASRTPKYPVCDSEESIIDNIADNLSSVWDDETGDDTGSVYEAVKSVDKSFITPLVEAINAKLKTCSYYVATDIVLSN